MADTSSYLLPSLLFVLAVGFVLSGLSALYARSHPTPGSQTGIVILVAVMIWIVGTTGEYLAAGLAAKTMWYKFQFFGMCMVPPGWLVYALQYAGREKWITRRTLALLGIVPFLTLILVLTNETHGLVWTRIWLSQNGFALAKSFSVVFWLILAYHYALSLLGVLIVAQAVLRPRREYRRQSVVLLFVALMPWLIHITIYAFGVQPFIDLDLTPLTLGLTIPSMVWEFVRLGQLDLMPVARDTVIDSMADAVIVLDGQARILDVNPAARILLGSPAGKLIGQPLSSAWPEIAGELTGLAQKSQASKEVTASRAQDRRVFEMRYSPVLDWRGHTASQVIVFRDITGRKQREMEGLKRAAMLDGLRRIGLELAAELDLHSLLNSIARRSCELLNGTTASFYLYMPAQDMLELCMSVGATPLPIGTRLCRGEGLSGRILETGEPLVVADYQRWEGHAHVYDGLPIEAVVGVPIHWAEEVLGVLVIVADAPRTFSDADVTLLNLFANQAAVAIRNARALETETQLRRRAEGLARATAALTSTLELDLLLQNMLAAAIQAFPSAHKGSVILVDRNTSDLAIRATVGYSGACVRQLSLSAGSGYAARAVREGKALLVPDASQESITGDCGIDEVLAIRSAMAAPLRYRGQVIGVLSLDNDERKDAFTPQDLDLLLAFADQAAMAVENTWLFGETRGRMEELAKLRQVAGAVSSKLDLPAVLSQVAQSTAELLHAETAAVILINADGKTRTFSACYGKHAERMQGLVRPLDVEVAGYVIRTRESVIVDDLLTDPRATDFCMSLGFQTTVTAPLATKDRVIGCLVAFNKQTQRHFTPGDLWLLTALADQTTAVVENARLYEQAQHQIAERIHAEEQLKRYTAELERSNGELQQFAYVASHDLQEPLRMVTSYLQLLQRRYSGQLDPNADEFIAFAVDGAARMRELVQGLLEYSRVGTLGQPFGQVNCQVVLEHALANLKVAIAESGAVVQSASLPIVQGDETQLAQLFQNLIGNAIKFRAAQAPRVEVGAQQRSGEWEFWVKDNGIGIEPQYSERIFAIFQRLHTRDQYPGTGIGLAVCKRIVERHGGRIWVESVPGQGSTFRFIIPAAG